jgi:methyl-accepting chemotaxis protein
MKKIVKKNKKGGDNVITDTTEDVADIVVNTTDNVKETAEVTKEVLLDTVDELKEKVQETGEEIMDAAKENLDNFVNDPEQQDFVADVVSKGVKTGAVALKASLPALESVADETLEIVDRKIPKLLNYASRATQDLFEIIPGVALLMEAVDLSTTVATAANSSVKIVNKNIEAISEIQDNIIEAKDDIFDAVGDTIDSVNKKRDKIMNKDIVDSVGKHVGKSIDKTLKQGGKTLKKKRKGKKQIKSKKRGRKMTKKHRR